MDHHGNEVLSLGSFALLPEHVVRLILSREELNADELTKFQAALHWSQRYCDASPGSSDLREVIANFFECIEFYKIPATVLMREVHPLGVVPDDRMMNALAFQVRRFYNKVGRMFSTLSSLPAGRPSSGGHAQSGVAFSIPAHDLAPHAALSHGGAELAAAVIDTQL